uniref:Uncharacterized protein n=1 Tax=Takifugu rubripes TaxID=31033 RepID=A0A674MN43_TAKRU
HWASIGPACSGWRKCSWAHLKRCRPLNLYRSRAAWASSTELWPCLPPCRRIKTRLQEKPANWLRRGLMLVSLTIVARIYRHELAHGELRPLAEGLASEEKPLSTSQLSPGLETKPESPGLETQLLEL